MWRYQGINDRIAGVPLPEKDTGGLIEYTHLLRVSHRRTVIEMREMVCLEGAYDIEKNKQKGNKIKRAPEKLFH
jgi:hypothetical protein